MIPWLRGVGQVTRHAPPEVEDGAVT